MARKPLTIDQPRYAKWVEASNGLTKIAPGLPVFIQGLGKIDAQLAWEDAAFLALPAQDRASLEESIKLTDRITLSRLWLLGAYEVIRTLSQRVKANPRALPKRLGERVHRVKREFARVRMPLAKLEPAKSHAKTDFADAVPAMNRQLGISWKVAKRVIVPRHKMSERLLKLLLSASAHK